MGCRLDLKTRQGITVKTTKVAKETKASLEVSTNGVMVRLPTYTNKLRIFTRSIVCPEQLSHLHSGSHQAARATEKAECVDHTQVYTITKPHRLVRHDIEIPTQSGPHLNVYPTYLGAA